MSPVKESAQNLSSLLTANNKPHTHVLPYYLLTPSKHLHLKSQQEKNYKKV